MCLCADPADVPQDPDKQLVPWWQLKPKQSSPPRQTLMHPPGEVARFVADQAIYSNKVRSGKSTQIGGELDIPQVSNIARLARHNQPEAKAMANLHHGPLQGPRTAVQGLLQLQNSWSSLE